MAMIPLYLDGPDIDILNDWLNQEDEIAFLVSNGPGKWIAKSTLTISEDLKNPRTEFGLLTHSREYTLWHTPSGPLPLIQPSPGGVMLKLKEEDWKHEEYISNPWEGWREKVAVVNPTVPFFNGHPGIISLSIIPTDAYRIYISSFSWVGNYNSILGSKAAPVTEKFWKRLRYVVQRSSTHIPHQNKKRGRKQFYAFPAALKEIQNGKLCE